MCVIGRDSARPGIGSILALEPVQITTTSPRKVRVPSAAVTSIVLGPTKRPCPLTSSAPLSRYASTFRATMPSTIFRLRSRTGRHLDIRVARCYAEFGASAEIVGDLGAVDHVFARGAGDGRAGSR